MPKPGYTQSPEHKKKRLEQIEGDGNGSYKDGRRSYRRKAGAKENDGTVVHHKNGDRTNNCASNLERLTDGDRTPGRRTTPAHEKHHGGRHGDSIAIRLAIRNDRKPGGCGKGKVGFGGKCVPSKTLKVGGLALTLGGALVANNYLTMAAVKQMQKKQKEEDQAKAEIDAEKHSFLNKEREKERTQSRERKKGYSERQKENAAKVKKRLSMLREENTGLMTDHQILRQNANFYLNKGNREEYEESNKQRRQNASEISSLAKELKKRKSYDSLLPTTIAILHHDRKPGGCGKGKVGDGTGRCKPAKRDIVDDTHKKMADFLSDRLGFGQTNKQIRKVVRQGYPAGLVAGGLVAAGVVGKKVYDKAKLREKLNEPQTPQEPESSKLSRREEHTARVERRRQKIEEEDHKNDFPVPGAPVELVKSLKDKVNNEKLSEPEKAEVRRFKKLYGKDIADLARKIKSKNSSYGTNADSLIPTAIAILHHDRKPGGCGKGKVGTGTGRCKAAKLAQVTPFSHRTPAEADAARREKLLIQAGKVAVGVGVTGGLAAIALKGEDHANPYHDPPEVVPAKKVEPPVNKPQKPVDSPVLKPPFSSREEVEESLRSLSRIASPEKEHKATVVSAPQDKGVAAKVKTPSNDAPESEKKKWLITKLLPEKATVMERSAYVPPVRISSSYVPVGALDNPSHGTQFYGLPKRSGRKRKELAKTSYRTGQLTEGEKRTRMSR